MIKYMQNTTANSTQRDVYKSLYYNNVHMFLQFHTKIIQKKICKNNFVCEWNEFY